MKIDLRFYIILALLVALVISILTRRPAERTDLTPYKVEIAHQQLVIDSLTKSRSSLNRKIQEDSILQSEQKQAYQKSITGLRARLSKRRIRVDSIILDRPEVNEFISMQDSVISIQAGRIDTLENALTALRVDIKSLNRNFDLAMEAQVQKYDALESINKLNEKALRKQQRKTKLATALIPVAAVGMFLLGTL